MWCPQEQIEEDVFLLCNVCVAVQSPSMGHFTPVFTNLVYLWGGGHLLPTLSRVCQLVACHILVSQVVDGTGDAT